MVPTVFILLLFNNNNIKKANLFYLLLYFEICTYVAHYHLYTIRKNDLKKKLTNQNMTKINFG